MKSLLRRLQSNEESSSSEVGKGSQLRDSWVHNARGRLSFPGRRGDAKCATGLSGWLNTVARHTLPLQPPSSSSCPSHNANEGSPMVAETLSSVVTKPNMQADSNTGVGLVDTDKDEGPFSTLSLEKECQLQLARASSVQDKPNVVHIEVVSKQISLGNLSSPAHTPAEALAVRYWHHNVLDYDDNIVDGFYDVYGDVFGSNKETMTSLVDLQRRSSSKNISQEVVLVDRVADPDLKELVKNVATLAVDSKAVSLGPLKSGLVEKIAGLVAKQMGGPVIDLDEILKRWKICREEFRFSHQSIVLPLGCLQVGLVRHRALLFKVLADTVGIPCKLLKGRQFTGSDEGAINVIRLADAREFIVDLMGVPGTLIPSNRFSVGVVTAVELHPVFLSMGDMKTELIHSLVPSEFGMSKGCMDNDEGVEMYAAEHPGNDVEKQANETQEHQMMGLPPPRPSHSRSMKSYGHDRSPSWTEGIGSLFLQDMKVMDVSQYMMNAAKENPQLAQKLHDVLLESGVVAPCSLFTDISPRELKLQASEEKKPSVVDGKKDLEGSVMEIQDSSAESEYSHAPMHKEFQVVEERLNESPPKICSVEGLADTRKDNTQSSDGILEMVSNGGDGLRDFQDRDMYSCGFPAEEEFLSDKSNKSISVKSDSVMDDVSEWEIPWEEIAIGERIGIDNHEYLLQEVAVKKFLDQDISGDALEEFRSEVRIMTRLRHPNVVLFMGAITRVPNLSIVTEFLPRGSLYRLIHRTNNQLDERRRLCMALDVARGMNYLHRSTPVIVHRDLKSPNLLVDKNWVVKVCDFGLSRMKSNTFLSSKSSSGTPEWMAPEHLRNEPSNEKCDVYSFGVILCELSTLKKPWGSLSPMQVVGAVGFQHRRLDIPDYVDPIIAKLVLQCWQSDPKLRPSFAEILAALKPQQKLFLPHYLSDAKKPGILVDCPQCKILQFPDENKVKRADP